MQRKIIALACVGVLAAAAVCLLWFGSQAQGVSFLHQDAAAEWIVYPKPAVPYRQAVAELPAVFRQTIHLQQAPGSASLLVRSCRRCSVLINGKAVGLPAPTGNWKAVQTIAVGPYLAAGENSISVAVFNRVGPPALRLSLRGPGLTLKSDESWQSSYAGAIWQPAQLASQPPPAGRGNPLSVGAN